jgi:bifunctional non-homologous end joining protein LigD
MAAAQEIVVDGKQVRITNRAKVLYPASGFTKGQVIDYYQAIAPTMLPYLRGRTVTMKRFPDGVEGESFFGKHCPPRRPAWVHTARVAAENEKGEVNYCVVDNAATLVWMAQLATLEFHVSLARAERIERPTSVVFDFDPGAPATIVESARVALLLREECDRLGLQAFPKVSGSKGIHIYIPLNTPVTYEQTKPWAEAMADLLVERAPDLVVSNMRRDLREGRVLVDWSQNAEHKTTVCVYSMRGKAQPTVSMPIEWSEIEALVSGGDPKPLVFGPERALERVKERGDLFEPVLSLRQKLPDIGALSAA